MDIHTEYKMKIWDRLTPEQRDYDRLVAKSIPHGASFRPETSAGRRMEGRAMKYNVFLVSRYAYTHRRPSATFTSITSGFGVSSRLDLPTAAWLCSVMNYQSRLNWSDDLYIYREGDEAAKAALNPHPVNP